MFEILEHTADIGFRAWGRTAEEMFTNAARALLDIAVDIERAEPRQAYPIAAAGEDYESLLVNWLSEILYYLDGEGVVLSRFEVKEIGPRSIQALAWGEARDSGRHAPKLVVKGVTYHLLEVRHDEDGWSARVFLDI